MIKLFEQYNEYNQVKKWLDDMGLINYTINDDLTVDVDGSVNINNRSLSEIPIQFGIINRSFDCSRNDLTTLNGCPKEVLLSFDCSNNLLNTLEGCPEKIGSHFDCSNNRLTTLKYIPSNMGGGINIGVDDKWITLPYDIINFCFYRKDTKILVKYQEEYGIWNSDGSFNKARFDFFHKDFKTGILT